MSEWYNNFEKKMPTTSKDDWKMSMRNVLLKKRCWVEVECMLSVDDLTYCARQKSEKEWRIIMLGISAVSRSKTTHIGALKTHAHAVRFKWFRRFREIVTRVKVCEMHSWCILFIHFHITGNTYSDNILSIMDEC